MSRSKIMKKIGKELKEILMNRAIESIEVFTIINKKLVSYALIKMLKDIEQFENNARIVAKIENKSYLYDLGKFTDKKMIKFAGCIN